MSKDSHKIKSYKELSISTNNLKTKYYDSTLGGIDMNRIKSDITKLKLDIQTLNKGNGLYTYDSENNKFVKLFEDLEIDYIHTLEFKLEALERFKRKILDEDEIIIPDRIKKYKESLKED